MNGTYDIFSSMVDLLIGAVGKRSSLAKQIQKLRTKASESRAGGTSGGGNPALPVAPEPQNHRPHSKGGRPALPGDRLFHSDDRPEPLGERLFNKGERPKRKGGAPLPLEP